MKNSLTHSDRRHFPRFPVNSPEKFPFRAYVLDKDGADQMVGDLLDFSQEGAGIKIRSMQAMPRRESFLYAISFNTPDEENVSKALGIIRSANTVVDADGKPFCRLGIQFVLIPDQKKPVAVTADFPIRPMRYAVKESCLNEAEISFALDGEEIKGRFLNFSKFGIAIRIAKEAPLKLVRGEKLKAAVLKIHDRILFNGDLILRNVRENFDCFVLGCEAEGKLIDVEHIQRNIEASVVLSDINKKFKLLAGSRDISGSFKAAILDLKFYFERVQEIFSKKENSLSDDALREIFPRFKEQMDEIYERFTPCIKQLSVDEHETYKSYFQKNLNSLLLTSPFVKHCQQRPYGYSGDYEMVLKVLDKEVEGTSPLGKLINVYAWNTGAAAAHRNRIGYLTEKIQEVFQKKENPRVLSIGCGPSREIKLFFEKHLSDKECLFTLVDFDARALAHCQEELLSVAKLKCSKARFGFVNKSIRQIIKSERCDSNFDQYDFIYCAGLFDYLSDPFCKRLLEIMYSQLVEDGLLIATNVTGLNYYRYYMEFMGEWYLTHRSNNDMLNLARHLQKSQGAKLEIVSDQTGVNAFLNVRKNESPIAQKREHVIKSRL